MDIEKQLRATLGKMELALGIIEDAIIWTDQKGTIRWCNTAFDCLVGQPHIQILSQSILDFLPLWRNDVQIRGNYHPLYQALSAGNHRKQTYEFKLLNESLFFEISAKAWMPPGEELTVIFVLHDVTLHIQTEKKMNRLATHDYLTNLANRSFFEEFLIRAIERSLRTQLSMGLLYIDLDDFKKVNDTFGHAMGDVLLKDVAQRLQATIRQDDFVARLGGDEFAIILNGLTGTEVAENIAQRINQIINSPYNLNGHRTKISGSIGLSICPLFSKQATTLVRMADTAMYKAKKTGKNQYQMYDISFEQEVMHPPAKTKVKAKKKPRKK